MPFKSKLIVIDRGWNKIMRELKRTDKSYVKVGVQESAMHKPSSKGSQPTETTSMVAIAVANEFGVSTPSGSRSGFSTVRIPERSFFRSTTDEQKQHLIALKAKAIRDITSGRTTVKRQLNKIGLDLGGEIKKKIKDLRSPPNAQSTIDAKGSSNPLMDTGQLRAAIKSEVHVIG